MTFAVSGGLLCKFGPQLVQCLENPVPSQSRPTFEAHLRWLDSHSAAASVHGSVQGGREATPRSVFHLVLDAIKAAPRSERDEGMLSVALELEARER